MNNKFTRKVINQVTAKLNELFSYKYADGMRYYWKRPTVGQTYRQLSTKYKHRDYALKQENIKNKIRNKSTNAKDVV